MLPRRGINMPPEARSLRLSFPAVVTVTRRMPVAGCSAAPGRGVTAVSLEVTQN